MNGESCGKRLEKDSALRTHWVSFDTSKGELLMNTPKKGIFITIEGGHGTGKTACISHLRERLVERGQTVVLTNDQSGTALGKQIRAINLTNHPVNPDFLTEALLIAAASRQNLVEVIRPSLARGDIVICERYGDAFYAFQGFGRHIEMAFLQSLRSRIEEGMAPPDVTLLLDAPAAVTLSRLLPASRHRIERECLHFHEAVRQGYITIASDNQERITVIDALMPLPDVLETAWQHLCQKLKL